MASYTEQQLHQNFVTLASMNHAIDLGLTNQNITDANTVAGLRTKIEAVSVPEVSLPLLRQCSANLEIARVSGLVADADILSLTTAAGLRAIFTTIDSTLDSAERRTFGFTNA